MGGQTRCCASKKVIQVACLLHDIFENKGKSLSRRIRKGLEKGSRYQGVDVSGIIPDLRGELPMVREHIRNVSDLASSRSAFAALLNDRTVVTWGDVRFGGNSDDVSEQLKEAAVTGAWAVYHS